MRNHSSIRPFGICAIAATAGLFGNGAANADVTIEKILRVSSGTVHLNLDPNALSDARLPIASRTSMEWQIATDSSMPVVSANDQFVRLLAGRMQVERFVSATGSGLDAALANAVIESRDPFDGGDMLIVDATTGAALFDLYGIDYRFDPATESLGGTAQLRVSESLAESLKQPGAAGAFVGQIEFVADLTLKSWTSYDHGDPTETIVFPENPAGNSDRGGPNPGVVDVIVGDLPQTLQGGRAGSDVGVSVATTSCNRGTIPLNWFALPNVDHPVIPQNMYRLKNDRFEQIGHSWLKHAFTALQGNACGFGCTGGCSGSNLCGGCSDPYSASRNGGQTGIGGRGHVNPFTGVYLNTANMHAGHSHTGTSHRMVVADADLDPAQNAGAQYFCEAQYVTPHEFNHAASRTARVMFNNASYRRVIPSGAVGGTWTFGNSGNTVREQPAINAWTGALQKEIEPAPGADGMAIVAYKVTNPSAGVWHYEYVLYNMNLDRGISSFSVPAPAGVNISNIEFRGVRQHPGFSNDGTAGSAGYSNTAWAVTRSSTSVDWSTETFAANPNANAIRWGTLYNFRFDADRPAADVDATIGFFKTATTGTVSISAPQAPTACPGDLNGNRSVDLADLAVLLSNFGVATGATPEMGDLDADTDVDIDDLSALLSLFGTVCP